MIFLGIPTTVRIESRRSRCNAFCNFSSNLSSRLTSPLDCQSMRSPPSFVKWAAHMWFVLGPWACLLHAWTAHRLNAAPYGLPLKNWRLKKPLRYNRKPALTSVKLQDSSPQANLTFQIDVLWLNPLTLPLTRIPAGIEIVLYIYIYIYI